LESLIPECKIAKIQKKENIMKQVTIEITESSRPDEFTVEGSWEGFDGSDSCESEVMNAVCKKFGMKRVELFTEEGHATDGDQKSGTFIATK
jgi:hypothetical protein